MNSDRSPSPRRRLRRIRKATRAQSARRWELTSEEMARARLARDQSKSPLGIARLLARSPRLIPEIGLDVVTHARLGVARSSALTWLLDSERVRSAVPDAARGVGFHDERPFLDALLPLLEPGTRVVDVGSGDGRIARHVAPRVGSVVCADPSATMVREAQENLGGLGNVHAERISGLTLSPLPSAAFDLAYAQGVISYLDLNETMSLLDETRRIVRNGAVFLVNAFTIDDRRRAEQHVEFVRAAAQRGRFSGGFIRPYTSDQLIAMLETVGFAEVVRAQPKGDDRWEPTLFTAQATDAR